MPSPRSATASSAIVAIRRRAAVDAERPVLVQHAPRAQRPVRRHVRGVEVEAVGRDRAEGQHPAVEAHRQPENARLERHGVGRQVGRKHPPDARREGDPDNVANLVALVIVEEYT